MRWWKGTSKVVTATKKVSSEASSGEVATLSYWNGRGRAEIIRLMLIATDRPFIHAIPGAGVDYLAEPEHLQHLRDNNYLLAGQVPLLRIDGMNLVQSMATARYVARQGDLFGDSAQEEVMCDVIAECILDWKKGDGCCLGVWFGWPGAQRRAACQGHSGQLEIFANSGKAPSLCRNRLARGEQTILRGCLCT